MDTEQITMGAAFKEWALLTQDYAAALEALRRLEPGASLSLVQIGRRMESCRRAVLKGPTGASDSETVVPFPPPPRPPQRSTGAWLVSALSPLLTVRAKTRHHAVV